MKKTTSYLRRVLLTLSLCATIPAWANVSGAARVIDGDTLDVGGQVVRLYGIDAPENAQRCKNPSGKSYTCGISSQQYLSSLLSSRVDCSGTEFDAYDRLIAICQSQGVNLNRKMVQQGYAVAYRKYASDYIAEELQASHSGRGLWAGTFEMPWKFRAQRWQASSAQAPVSNCPIKGNINRKGERIYHTPWSSSYARTKINTARSERWFCSEDEALAAGWRAPRQ